MALLRIRDYRLRMIAKEKALEDWAGILLDEKTGGLEPSENQGNRKLFFQRLGFKP
jgi:hypothetical protein